MSTVDLTVVILVAELDAPVKVLLVTVQLLFFD